MNRVLKVIPGHAYWCQQKSRTDCYHNVNQCWPYFRNLRRPLASGKLQIRWHSCTRSFVLQSITDRQRAAYRHIKYCWPYEVAIQITKNCRRRQPHSHLTPQPRGTPTNISMHLYISSNEFFWPTFFSLIIWDYGSIFIQLSKVRTRLPTSRSLWLWSYISPFLRYGELGLLATRSSATAEKQRVSWACLPRLANWSCNVQNTAESQRLYYFWHSNALIPEFLAKNGFYHKIG